MPRSTTKSRRLETDFATLQSKLAPMWRQIGRADPGSEAIEAANTVVVLPSLTVDIKLDTASQQGYEERMLFMLFLLRQPNIRLFYFTSLPVSSLVVDYYLHILPGVAYSNARKRLTMLSPEDASAHSLSEKLLDRPQFLAQARSLIHDLDNAHLVPFLTTDLERQIALHLGIPMYAADPRFFAFGAKSGCRRIFAEEGVSHPLGIENITSEAGLLEAVADLRRQRPAIVKVIVKHNEGVSGYGNATVDLAGLPPPSSPEAAAATLERLQQMHLELPGSLYAEYIARLEKQGGIVEEMITGEVITSPSAQLRITPLREVECLSTHDQILGGPSGQIYLGARFPADPAYAPLIMDEAEKIGLRFAREGIVGRFAIDFIAVRPAGGSDWQVYAIEVNLRKGGTTHPFLTLQYLTGGAYEPATGLYHTALGQQKYYVATDNLKSAAYRQFTPADLLDLVSETRLHFDHTSQTGIVLHMFSSVAASGRLGLTAIGDTPAQADDIYQRFVAALDREAERRGGK